jgi:hypothetical protein
MHGGAALAADPMRPTPGAAAPLSTTPSAEARAVEPALAGLRWRLVSIRSEPDQAPAALLGEQWVRAGETVDGWRIVTIEAESVRIARGAEHRTLRLWPAAAAAGITRRTTPP